MSDEEFAEEKFGLNAEKQSEERTFTPPRPIDQLPDHIPQPKERFYGLIEEPNGQNTPEELERLEEIYSAIDKQYLPASYDSRAYGM